MSEPPPERPTVALIDLQALAHNFALARRAVGPGVKIFGVVKADAYGHGAVPVARMLERIGADLFGGATCEEGGRLREGGVRRPIVVLGGLYPGQGTLALQHDLEAALFDLDTARTLAREARQAGGDLRVHVKVDTGMGRVGLLPPSVAAFVAALREVEGLRIVGLFSHFAVAGEPDGAEFTREQLKRFQQAADEVRALGHRPLLHLANSAALLEYPESHLDAVRPGLMLYGVLPHPAWAARLPLRPVLSLRTRVVFLKEVPAGTGLGYGRTFITPRPSRIATLPVGYADGLSRALSNRGEVLVRGRRAPIRGMISMDWCMVDVTDVPGVALGDEAVLIGGQADATIRVEEVAARLGTIPYEILTSVGSRVPRRYLGEDPEAR
ncbi:MAG: alanine racemase [Deltaproteobacteria bacterium]|nr:alanine racemase [Deltaproteobacteria bacterium]